MPSRFLTLWSMLAKPGQQHQQPISDKKKKNKKDTSATQVNKTPKLFLATFDILWRPTLPTGVATFLVRSLRITDEKFCFLVGGNWTAISNGWARRFEYFTIRFNHPTIYRLPSRSSLSTQVDHFEEKLPHWLHLFPQMDRWRQGMQSHPFGWSVAGSGMFITNCARIEMNVPLFSYQGISLCLSLVFDIHRDYK